MVPRCTGTISGDSRGATPPEKDGDKANGKANGKPEPCPDEQAASPAYEANSKGKALGHQQLKLVESTTSYLYDELGLNVLKEYKDRTAPRAEYYYVNGQVLGRKMFGLKGEVLPDRESGLANGGMYYYLTDALGSVTDLTDHQGNVARKYRYDAFGGLFTDTVGLYNAVSLTGKSYDPKAGLMDFSARWYDPVAGRFTQSDTYPGTLDDAISQHRYAYVGNNPINWTDPTGHMLDDGGGGSSDHQFTYGAWSLVSRTSAYATVEVPESSKVETFVTSSDWNRTVYEWTNDRTLVGTSESGWSGDYTTVITWEWDYDFWRWVSSESFLGA